MVHIAPPQTGDHVWSGRVLSRDPEAWTWSLDDREIDELIAAAKPWEQAGHDPASITRHEFCLPTLGPRLVELRERLVSGRGFELIRGLPISDLGSRQAAIIFVGIGAHLGALRSQNAAGHLLGHVRDEGRTVNDPSTRIYQTARRQTFHTDSADVVGLACLETAAEGGTSMVVSASTIYNEMLERSPHLAGCLFEPVATDRRGEVPQGGKPFFEIPVLNWYDESLTVIYQRQYIESAQRFPDAPRLSSTMIAALDLFDALANDPALHLAMDLEVGDMQFVHNHSMMHDRTEFVNKVDAPRHLLRLWLSVEGDRRLPPVFEQRYGPLEVGDRGGIVIDGVAPCLSLNWD